MAKIDWSNPDLDLDKITGIPDIESEFITNDKIFQVQKTIKSDIVSKIEDIEDIKGNITITNSDGIMKFEFNGDKIGIIDYMITKDKEIYIDMIGNINAKQDYFDEYDFLEKYDFEKIDLKIEKLIFYMYEIFFIKIQSDGYNTVFCIIENENLYDINNELIKKGIIKNTYTRINDNNQEEFVIEL